MRVLLTVGGVLIFAGWIWQTRNLLADAGGWRRLWVQLGRDPAFGLVLLGVLLVFIAVIFL